MNSWRTVTGSVACTLAALSMPAVAFAGTQGSLNTTSHVASTNSINVAGNLLSGVPKVTPEHPNASYTLPDGTVVTLNMVVMHHEHLKMRNFVVRRGLPVSINYSSGTKGGTTYAGSGYADFYNVEVYATFNDIATCSFYADFTSVEGGQSYISDVSQASVLTSPGYKENSKSLTIVQQYENLGTGQPAQAQLKFNVTGTDGIGSYDYELNLFVGNSTYSTSAI